MTVISSFSSLPNSQPRYTGQADSNTTGTDERAESARKVFAELVDDNNLAVPVSAVIESAGSEPQYSSQQRFFSERINLGSISGYEGLPLNNQQALASYQTVANNSPGGGFSHLDIIV